MRLFVPLYEVKNKGSFFISYYPKEKDNGTTPLLALFHFTLDPYLIMLSVKQGGVKYYFLSLWYDLTWDWTPLFRVIWGTLYSLGQSASTYFL